MSVQHVWARWGGSGAPAAICHQVSGANEDGKSAIQIPDGGVVFLDFKAFGTKDDIENGEFCPAK